MNIWPVVLAFAAVVACLVWARSLQVWAIVAAMVLLTVVIVVFLR